MDRTVRSLSLMRFPAVLESYSIPPLDLLSRAGLSPNIFLSGDCWLPRSLCFSLAETAMEMTGSPFFGAEVGAAIQFGDLGSFGAHITAAPTLGEALATARSELRLLHKGALLHQETKAQESFFHFHFTGNLTADPLQYELGTLAVLRSIALLAGEADGIRIHTTLPRLRNTDVLEHLFGAHIEFGQSLNAVIVDRDMLPLPVLRQKERGTQPDLVLIMRTAALIAQLLPDGYASLEQVALRQRLTERTLQRKLAKFGITFEELLDTTRRDEAMRMLQMEQESLAEIAFRLGYSNQANFNRAFHRWTGIAPMAYRQKLRNTPGING
jgi:AraC-like DNA-binding protein